jgi:integrase
MAKKLTDIAIGNLKPGPVRREIPDQGGLYVVLQPSGRRRFCVRYRHNGASRKMTLPAGISLAQARKLAADAMFEVARGNDPSEAKKAATAKAEAAAKDTLQAVCAEYMTREGKKLRTAGQRDRILERLVYPALGDRQIDTIERLDITRLLDTIQDRNGARMADMALAVLRKVFNWHATRSNRFSSPVVRGMARAESKARSRTLTDDELRRVWQTAEEAGPFGALLQFLLLTGARRNEASEMPWTELDGDDWILPPARNKVMARRKEQVDLVRPLAKAALAVLGKQPRIDGCVYLFTTDGRRPLSGFSKFKRRFDAKCGVTDWVIHDLRRTARSLMSRARVDSDHAERCLGHVIGGVRGTYDRHEYHAEKKHAFQALAALIERILRPTDNIIPVRGRG